MVKIGLIGSTGRMGKAVSESISKNGSDAVLSAVMSSSFGSVEEVFDKSDVVIDFSTPEVCLSACAIAVKCGKVFVSGTTGFSDEQYAQVLLMSKDAKLVFSSNMSLGVNLLFLLTKKLSSILHSSLYDIEVLESHHVNKKDAPSGTAITLASMACEGRGIDFKKSVVFSRSGVIGKKDQNTIGVSSTRTGGTIGDHTVMFGSENDRIEISHKAFSRSIFSDGAVLLAKTAFTKLNKNGIYTFTDVIDSIII